MEFDISLPMESLFEQPTVVELGELGQQACIREGMRIGRPVNR